MNGRADDGRRGDEPVAGDEECGHGRASSSSAAAADAGEQLTSEIGTFRIGRRVALPAGARRSAQDLGVVVEDVAA